MPEQDIPIVPQADLSYGDPAINEPLILPPIDNPYLSVWWATQTVSNVPENVMGWLVAQGYEITGITQDTTTVPPTNYFSLTRQGICVTVTRSPPMKRGKLISSGTTR